MITYRLTLPQYANDLSGTGAAIYGGRWNSIGNFLLYTSETSSLSILEHLVHITGADSIKYILSEIDLSESGVQETSIPFSIIRKLDEKDSARIGDDWLKGKSTPILKVPSIVNPLESNYLINPLHPELNIRILTQEWFVYDRRLTKV